MKRYCFYLLLIILASSCTWPFSRRKSIGFQEELSYCNLLHIPSVPYTPSEPKPFLGIYFAPKKFEQSDLQCKENNFIHVTGVIDGTPAVEAGIKKDDLVLSFNGKPVCESEGNVLGAFKKAIEQQGIGSSITMDILREDEKFSVTAKLIERPTKRQSEAENKNLETCSNESSLLKKTLQEKDSLALFNGILKNLDRQSDVIQNMKWIKKNLFNPFQLREMTYMMRYPLQAGVVARGLSDQLISETKKRDWQMDSILRRSAHLLDVDLPFSSMPEDITFDGLLESIKATKAGIEKSLSNLSQEEKNMIRENAISPWDKDKWDSILDIAVKINREEFLNSFSPLLSYLSRDNLSILREELLSRFEQHQDPILFERVTPMGKVIVGGTGPNIYSEDAAVILDLGGDDLYLNNAGGTRPAIPVALVIDWNGDDRYLNKENFSQGAGVLGGGFLIDLSGDDTYSSLSGSQGAGFFGIGFLYDEGGSGIYNSRSFSQGVGQAGIGIIWNRDGDSNYICLSEGQALGLFGGAGILIDEAGNDYYRLEGLKPDFRDPLKSTVSMGQGFGEGVNPVDGISGISGGMGILIDKNGDDTYIADYFAQGASYYYGVGILNDLSGNDRYISGRYAQGAGIHSSIGVFLDKEGNDFYYSSFGVSQGLGHDFGIGFFEDTQGDDRYIGGGMVQGSATGGGLGILIDTGGRDIYKSSDKAQAFVQEEECIGIMIDTEPEDDLISNHKDALSIRVGFKKPQ